MALAASEAAEPQVMVDWPTTRGNQHQAGNMIANPERAATHMTVDVAAVTPGHCLYRRARARRRTGSPKICAALAGGF
jgi:hypothetical protein